MQVEVQKSMRTTFPRRPAAVNGCELSHSVALPREGNSPSMGNLGCIAASKSSLAFMMNTFHLVGRVDNVRNLQLLDDRAGPSVRDDERQRIFMFRTNVNEMNVQPIDLGDEVREGLQLLLAL